MKVSILLYCENSNNEIVSFFQSLLKQTSTIHELVIFIPKKEKKTIQLAKQIKSKAPFRVHIHEHQNQSAFSCYFTGLKQYNSDCYLFARPEHPFKKHKVAFYKERLEENPYYKFLFANTEIVNTDDELVYHDYFGVSGFYERWDYYKRLDVILIKQIGFVNDIQTGISRQAADKIIQFFEDYPTFQPACNFEDFLAIYFAMNYQDEIKEIPYVLNRYKMADKNIEELKDKKRMFDYTVEEQLQWLKEYHTIATLVNKQHPILPVINEAVKFHQKRKRYLKQHSFNQFISLVGHYLNGNYYKFSSQPTTDLKKDLFNY